MSLQTLMTTTVSLQLETVGKDSSGGKTQTWADVYSLTDVSADVQPASSYTQMVYHQMGGFISHTVYTLVNIGATTKHRIRASDGSYYVVTGPTRDDSAGRGRVFATDVDQRPF
jgi:head-tail adaptor